ncbi:MAG: serine/threonine-protein kinase [Actinomycetaceae bacterium]|nr:serine/threonine-protein kinase [Actinomycetaceae bacterium]
MSRIISGFTLGNRYVLLSRIAVGGMGEVWQARDQKTSDIVAAKVLREELAGQHQFLARFEVEARNAQKAKHENLATVLDYGEEDGLAWLIMELVKGLPLTDLLANSTTMEPELLLSILYQTACALDAVHRAGVVHRDIKPANILITPEGVAKLTDFGISLGNNQQQLTAAGMVMGTAQYLPPEQAMGNQASSVGDLYALGVIAYEALAGKRPFTGKTQVDIAFSHVNDPVPPLPDTVPAPLVDLVMWLLKKDPTKRPQSARELARALSRISSELNNTAIPRTQTETTGKTTKETTAPGTPAIGTQLRQNNLASTIKKMREWRPGATPNWIPSEVAKTNSDPKPSCRTRGPRHASTPPPNWKKPAIAGIIIFLLTLSALLYSTSGNDHGVTEVKEISWQQR